MVNCYWQERRLWYGTDKRHKEFGVSTNVPRDSANAVLNLPIPEEGPVASYVAEETLAVVALLRSNQSF